MSRLIGSLRSSSTLLGLALALVVAVPVAQSSVVALGAVRYIVPLAVMLLSYLAYRQHRSATWLWPVGTIGFVGLFVLQAARTSYGSGLPLTVAIVPTAIALALFFAASVMPANDKERVLTFLVGVSLVEAVYAVVEAVATLPPLWGYTGDRTFTTNEGVRYTIAPPVNPLFESIDRAQGTLGHPLPLSLLLTVALAIVLRQRLFGLALRSLAILVLCAGILATGSRSGIVFAALVLVYLSARRITTATLAYASSITAATVIVFLMSGFTSSTLVTSLLESGSVTHRSTSIAAFSRLYDMQSIVSTWTGNGYYATEGLVRSGVLSFDGFYAVDNQIIATFIAAGLIGVGLLVYVTVAAVARATHTVRFALLALLPYFAIFDVMSWPSTLAIFALLLGFALTRAQGDSILRSVENELDSDDGQVGRVGVGSVRA